jgi:biotin operon repressor
MPLPRVSLSEQVAAFLKRGISTARWSRELPSEADLCRELQVSRSTLRKAIDQLARDGWLVHGGRRRHHRIQKTSKPAQAATGRIIRVLSPFSLRELGSVHHVLLDSAAERLGATGFRLEYEHRRALFVRHAPRELKRLAALPETAAWMVFYSTPEMQRWFAESGLPCLILGRLAEGVKLPCLFPDVPATARHAAGLFYQRGHRDLVYFHAELTSLNDRLGARTFVEEARKLGARAQIVTHGTDPAELRQQLDVLLRARPRPTAFFSNSPESCLTLLIQLLNTGWRVPAHASLIAGWDDEFLHYAAPSFACYRVDGSLLGAKAARILLGQIRRARAKSVAASVIPTFVLGDTLGPAP